MGDNIRLKGLLGLKQDIYDDKRAKEFKKLFQLTPKEFITEYEKKLFEEKKQEKNGGYMKVKKLLPGGLLNSGMRLMMRIARSKGLKKTPEVAEDEYKEFTKIKNLIQRGDISVKGTNIVPNEISNYDSVFKNVANILAKKRKAAAFEKFAPVFNKYKEIKPEIKEEIQKTIPKLREYSKQADEKMEALMIKEHFKPTMQKSGGFINMTKDKNYYKGRI
jgi:hypothetical protein